MPDKEKKPIGTQDGGPGNSGGGTAATVKPKRKKKSKPQKNPPQHLPPWRVLLHNDPHNTFEHVITTIIELTTLNEQQAKVRTMEADQTGVALLLVTHKERAELYKDQFESKSLTVSIEQAE